ncbi:helix-turn-helix transcriptional regulator [Paenibacillus sp. E222]|uniref:helix-turn-helix domain-containing protein n=1 Tax=Paenibacillus sp. E222 TaxID=2748863 RepID=UPI0015C58D60|nr:helix-turn-helix transcriptional regulator [Paenibacillus sp. E222]QLG36933.1 helix-turn-helix transcriptional regulator [Paenibacillus sp. E222]
MVNLNLKEVGKRIRLVRKSRYRTAKAFSEFLGLSERHIHNIESGKNLPSFEILAQITNEFHVTIDFILFGQKRGLVYEENWDALLNTFNSLSPDGRQTLFHIAKELLRLENKITGGNSE